MRPSIPLFDALAEEYEAHFSVPHRRAYDELAWDLVAEMLPRASGLIVDAGCGTGRWARRLVELGHRVVGVEESPAMAAGVRALGLGDRCAVIQASMEEVELPPRAADAVIAMGSLQYTRDPERTIHRFAEWTRPGGSVCVLVDSLVGLVLELIREGNDQESLERLRSRFGLWRHAGREAEHHLLDRGRLERAFRDAGLEDVRAAGLLVSASVLGVARLTSQLEEGRETVMERERAFASDPVVADVGKQILMTGRMPS